MPLQSSVRALLSRLNESSLRLVTAESLTGGLIGAAITAIPGSSSAYWGGIVSYSVDAKRRLLGVDASIIERYGVVSRETAEAMARGALLASGVDVSIAVTGVAGPSGGDERSPVGTVCIAVAKVAIGGTSVPSVRSERFLFEGSRKAVRDSTLRRAIELAISHLDSV